MSLDNSTSPSNATSSFDPNVVYENVILTLNPISIVCSVLVISLYFFARSTQRLNRISIRLAVATSACDIFYSSAQIWSELEGQGTPTCAASVWAYILGSHLTAFLIAMVAVNLHIRFLLNWPHREYYEWCYYLVAFAMAITLPSIGWASHQFGFEPVEEACWFLVNDRLTDFIWKWGIVYIWTSLVSLYSCVVVILVLIKSNKNLAIAEKKSLNYAQNQQSSLSVMSTEFSMAAQPNHSQVNLKKEANRKLMMALKRIILYPIIPILCQSFNIVGDVQYFVTGDNQFWVLLLSYLLTSIQGILNFIVFLSDPMVIPAVKVKLSETWQQLRPAPSNSMEAVMHADLQMANGFSMGSVGEVYSQGRVSSDEYVVTHTRPLELKVPYDVEESVIEEPKRGIILTNFQNNVYFWNSNKRESSPPPHPLSDSSDEELKVQMYF